METKFYPRTGFLMAKSLFIWLRDWDDPCQCQLITSQTKKNVAKQSLSSDYENNCSWINIDK